VPVVDAKVAGKPLAKERLDEYAEALHTLIARCQPLPPGMAIPPGRTPSEI
jgi:hypothetical protein